tara:strand:- start:73 stop:516 length:444 start_codon:yes stop_codon:yes gene_type:complete
MYSYKTQYPISNLPERIRLSNGSTRTDSSTFTNAELTDAGYVDVSDPPSFNSQTHKLTWDGTSWQTVALTDSEIVTNIAQQWIDVRSARKGKFEEVEWRVFRHQSQVRLGVTPTDNIADLDAYIQSLRDVTSQSDPYNITWPTLKEE